MMDFIIVFTVLSFFVAAPSVSSSCAAGSTDSSLVSASICRSEEGQDLRAEDGARMSAALGDELQQRQELNSNGHISTVTPGLFF